MFWSNYTHTFCMWTCHVASKPINVIRLPYAVHNYNKLIINIFSHDARQNIFENVWMWCWPVYGRYCSFTPPMLLGFISKISQQYCRQQQYLLLPSWSSINWSLSASVLSNTPSAIWQEEVTTAHAQIQERSIRVFMEMRAVDITFYGLVRQCIWTNQKPRYIAIIS